MEIRILGPLQAGEDGQLLELGPPKQRALLALLALHRNELVSADLLIDELRAGRPPAAAAKSIQVYGSQLRKSLGPSSTASPAATGSASGPTSIASNALGAKGASCSAAASLVKRPRFCARRSRSGAVRRLPTWPTSRSPRARSPGSRSSD